MTNLFRYDPAGRLIKTTGTSLTKTRYDGLGRVLRRWTLAADGTGIEVGGEMGAYASDYGDYDPGTADGQIAMGTLISGDVVLELQQSVYEQATGNLLGRLNISRSQAEPLGWASSALGTMGDLHTDIAVKPASIAAGNVKGRLQLTTYFYDDLSRVTRTGFWGHGGVDGFTDYDPITPTASSGLAAYVPGSIPSSSTEDVLVTRNKYNAKGELEVVADADGKLTRTEYTDDGRVQKTIRNYTGSGALPEEPGDPQDVNQTVEYAYTKGLLTSMTAMIPPSQIVAGSGPTAAGPQVTEYVYGTTKGSLGLGSPPASEIATGHLLLKTVYPPGTTSTDAADRTVWVAYNALGEASWTKDQLGNIIETERDHAGRITATHASTLGNAYNPSSAATGMTDDAVGSIRLAYDARGLISSIWQNAPEDNDVTEAVDHVKYEYDDYGMLTEIRQKVDGYINPSTPDGYAVSYTNVRAAPVKSSSAFVGRQGLRRTTMTLPGATTGSPKPHNASAVVSYDFGAAGDLNDLVGRVEEVNLIGDTGLGGLGMVGGAEYSYLGAAVLAGSELTVPGYTNRMYADGPTATNTHVVAGLDRFNRVKESRWGKVATAGVPIGGGSIDWYAYRTNVHYDAASSIVSTQDRVVPRTDVKYTNDDLHRLIAAQEGKLASGGGSVSNQNFKQDWSLSHTGNWLSFDETVGSGGTPTRTETRRNNAVNEIGSRVVDNGSAVGFVYNKAGQLVDDGEKIYTYDAWGRLRYVHVRDGVNDRGDLIEESRYNGLGHRIGYHSDQDLDNDVEDAGAPDPDPWIYNVYDDSWRIVAVFKAGSAADRPHERYVYHAAGMDGRGSSSYIDDVILRERDDDVLLTGTASESLTNRMYYLQNWRHDVVALVRENGSILERPRYSSYGVARTATVADFNHDGVVDDLDFALFTDSYDGYVVGYTEGGARGAGTEAWAACDLNMDGLVNDTDFGIWYPYYDDYVGITPGELSNRSTTVGENVDNRIGYAGYAWSANTATYNVRNRVYDPMMGSWMTRDPLGYVDSSNFLEYAITSPVNFIDALGLSVRMDCTKCTKQNGDFKYNCRLSDPDNPNYYKRKFCANDYPSLPTPGVPGSKLPWNKPTGNQPSSTPGDPYGRNGPLPPGEYWITPMRMGSWWGIMPVVTDNPDVPNSIKTPNGTNRDGIMVHNQNRYSDGCITTCSPNIYGEILQQIWRSPKQAMELSIRDMGLCTPNVGEPLDPDVYY